MTHYQISKYIGMAAIVLLIIGLAGWYFFLRTQTGDIASLDAARGFDIVVPSFTGSRSSTAENIEAGANAESLLATTEGQSRPPRLWRVSTSPIAGAAFLAGSTTLRYIERSTGYVYDSNPETGATVRRTKELIPKVYEGFIIGESSVVMRTVGANDSAATLLGRLGTTTEDGFKALLTSSLGDTIRAVAASPRQEGILMLASGSGGTHLVQARPDGSSPQQILTLGIGGFSIDWLTDDRVFLSERPSSGIPGNAYEVVKGALTPTLNGVPGLMIQPRTSSSAILYSSDDGTRIRLFARPSGQASTTELSVQTIAEKCVWAPSKTGTSSAPTLLAYCAVPQAALPTNFLNQWLRGATHTSDAWFTIDASAARASKFFTPETTVALDVESPSIDTSGNYIAFTNARDKSLWVLRIAN